MFSSQAAATNSGTARPSCLLAVRRGSRSVAASIGLGKYPLVTLAEARQTAFENRRAIAKGKDSRGGTPTFAEAAEKVIEVYAKGWKDSGRTASKVWRSCGLGWRACNC